MLGLSDISRETVNSPLRVETASSSDSLQEYLQIEPLRDRLVKGYNKVTLHRDRVSEKLESFVFSLRPERAFLSALSFSRFEDSSSIRVLDYSSGWQHDLLLLSSLDSNPNDV